MANKIRKGDKVIVLRGKDKGRSGTVTKVDTKENMLFVEGVNMVKKHVRPNPNANEQGGIKSQEAQMPIGKVAIFNPATKRADRVGFKDLNDGRKVRVFKKTGEQIDV